MLETFCTCTLRKTKDFSSVLFCLFSVVSSAIALGVGLVADKVKTRIVMQRL